MNEDTIVETLSEISLRIEYIHGDTELQDIIDELENQLVAVKKRLRYVTRWET